MNYNDLLLCYARRGLWKPLRKSAFRKYCRRNRGIAESVLTKEGFSINTIIGDSVDNLIFVYGIYEKPTTNVIKVLAPRCNSFVDVGCNIGYYSCLFGSKNPTARLFGIDPNPEMISRTKINLELNNLQNIKLLSIGAGADNCKMMLNIPEDRHSLSSVAYVPQRSNNVGIKSLQVDIVPLRDIIAQHNISNALLKVDAEGFEYQVFCGLSSESIKSISFIIFELSRENLNRANMVVSDLFSFPWLSAFDIYRIDDQNGGLIAETVQSLDGSHISANILLASREVSMQGLPL